MGELIILFTTWIKTHIAVVITGLLGAVVNALLSKESWKNRIIGSAAGFILALVFSDYAAQMLANGKDPYIFGFIIALMGKDTIELALSTMRKRMQSAIKKG